MGKLFEVRLKNARLVNQLYFTGKQADFARAIQKSPTYVNGMLNEPGMTNHKNIGETIARQIEQAVGLENGWMDRLHTGDEVPSPGSIKVSNTNEYQPTARRVVVADSTNPNYTMVRRKTVKFAAGDGEMVFDEPDEPPLAFTNDFLRKENLKVDNLVVAYATGNSMEPLIRDGYTMVIDLGDKNLTDDKVYALRVFDQLRVKRIRLMTNAVTLVSDNPDYPPELIEGEKLEALNVIGRVVCISGTL